MIEDPYTALVERGIHLRPATFAQLVLSRQTALTHGANHLMPMFTPERGATGTVLIAGNFGDPWLTGAVLIRECPYGLKGAIHDLTLFGDTAAPGEYAHIDGDTSMMDKVSGRIAVIGAVWKNPNVGPGILELFWPALVSTALEHDGVEWIVGLIRGDKTQRIGFGIEGFRHFWDFMTYRDPDWDGGYQVDDFTVCAMSRRHALERVLHHSDPIQPTRTA